VRDVLEEGHVYHVELGKFQRPHHALRTARGAEKNRCANRHGTEDNTLAEQEKDGTDMAQKTRYTVRKRRKGGVTSCSALEMWPGASNRSEPYSGLPRSAKAAAVAAGEVMRSGSDSYNIMKNPLEGSMNWGGSNGDLARRCGTDVPPLCWSLAGGPTDVRSMLLTKDAWHGETWASRGRGAGEVTS